LIVRVLVQSVYICLPRFVVVPEFITQSYYLFDLCRMPKTCQHVKLFMFLKRAFLIISKASFFRFIAFMFSACIAKVSTKSFSFAKNTWVIWVLCEDQSGVFEGLLELFVVVLSLRSQKEKEIQAFKKKYSFPLS
jgi:hypothetical protein